MKPMNVAARTGLHLIFEHLKLVPVGVSEPEDRAPVLLLDRVRDLDAVLAESRLLLRGVRRGEHESGVPLLRPGVGAEMEVDVRTSRRDRDPVGERGHDPEDRKSTRLNSSHSSISYAVFCLKKKKFRCMQKIAD